MADHQIELTILMPCLNEAETLGICIGKARRFLSDFAVSGEVLVADNGSADGSQKIAETEGARVVSIEERGYGAALRCGINAARGRYVIMGDADDSYNFTCLMPFLTALREGADLVMGNRFAGEIAPDAMPFLHKYLGNPVLSWIARLLFRIGVGDFHCGLRGFNRERILALNLRTTGMEFASEMVVRAGLGEYRIQEVPTVLSKAGRTRPPHLRTWRDGWRHLSFLLIYSPEWLFLYPGFFILLFGVFAAFVLLPGPVAIQGVGFDIHSFAVACTAILVGTQGLSFAVVARRFATANGLLPRSIRYSAVLDSLTFETFVTGGGVIAFIGFCGFAYCLLQWASTGFGPLEYSSLLRVLILSLTAFAMGVQLVLTGFLSALTEIPTC